MYIHIDCVSAANKKPVIEGRSCAIHSLPYHPFRIVYSTWFFHPNFSLYLLFSLSLHSPRPYIHIRMCERDRHVPLARRPTVHNSCLEQGLVESWERQRERERWFWKGGEGRLSVVKSILWFDCVEPVSRQAKPPVRFPVWRRPFWTRRHRQRRQIKIRCGTKSILHTYTFISIQPENLGPFTICLDVSTTTRSVGHEQQHKMKKKIHGIRYRVHFVLPVIVASISIDGFCLLQDSSCVRYVDAKRCDWQIYRNRWYIADVFITVISRTAGMIIETNLS